MHIEATFTQIYNENRWGSDESVSGPGSTFRYTENLRRRLPELIEKFSIASIFDAPCGDLNWMKHLLDDLKVKYIGGDIVQALIDSHNAVYARDNVSFVHADLTKDRYPSVDLMICRDCLFHLSYRDTLSVLQNFIDSNTKYLLTTTHKQSNRVRNIDIATGGVRMIDLFSAPYHFPADALFRIEDWVAPYQEREMCLWNRDQVIAARAALAGEIGRSGATPAARPNTQSHSSGGAGGLAALRKLALSLDAEGRSQEALLLLEHLASVAPHDAELLRPLVRLLNAEGRTLDALQRLGDLKACATDLETIVGDIEKQMPLAVASFNECLAAGHIEKAETYVSALVNLVPRNQVLLNAALSCNVALGRKDMAAKYAATLLSLDAKHVGARVALDEAAKTAVPTDEIDEKVRRALAPKPETHGLLRLRDLHDAASALLCRPLTQQRCKQVEQLLGAARKLDIAAPPGSEWEGWEKHYRLMLEAIDLSAVQGPTPDSAREPEIVLTNSSGAKLNWLELRAAAARLRAETVFFAAADKTYLDLYARSYIDSILKHCDVPCLIIVHAIGGAAILRDIAKSIGVRDKRLVFAGDRFDAKSIVTKCYDAPPKGQIAKPVAHLQSVRFLRLGSFLEKLKRPVFVSDIDLLLQRGVKDLLARAQHADIVLNENDGNTHAGSRLTANLLLANPTDNSGLFLRFLRSYLEQTLAGPEVSRWIDQLALLLARHHLTLRGSNPRIEYFDTTSDINNVMYTAYRENPFRFLSLYHGFDMSSLTPAAKMPVKKPKPKKPVRTRKSPATLAKRKKR